MLQEGPGRLCKVQERLYAQGQWVLLEFQAMDAAGKDGAIPHVMSGVKPQGCEVYSFKGPSAEERITTPSGEKRARAMLEAGHRGRGQKTRH